MDGWVSRQLDKTELVGPVIFEDMKLAVMTLYGEADQEVKVDAPVPTARKPSWRKRCCCENVSPAVVTKEVPLQWLWHQVGKELLKGRLSSFLK